MTSAQTTTRTAVDGIRIAIGVVGGLSLVAGVVILVWPGKTAMIVTAIIAAYTVVAGAIYAAVGGLSRSKGGWARVGHVLLGLVFIAAGVLAFMNLGQTALWLGVFLGVLIGVLWIVEGVIALSTLSRSGSTGWTLIFAIFSIAAGVVLLFAPLWGATVLWLLMGVSLVVLGVVNVVRAITLGRSRR